MSYLYLPITSQPREQDAKLLLAMFACESGFTPVIGYRTAFRAQLHRLKPGMFLVHNARQRPRNIERLSSFGHRVLVLDEEALVRQSDEIFLKKHPKDAFKHVERILCWGENDAALWVDTEDRPRCETTIVGNPRMDLMRPELSGYYKKTVEKLRDNYGDYVILNTNFPAVNNKTSQGGGVRLSKWALDARGQQIEREFLDNKRAMFEATLALLQPLAEAISPLTLVVRPHPNENHAPWEEAAKGVDNIHVIFEGGVVAWLLGAKALVHNNCTTAVEAAVVGLPVLNFRPWQSKHDNPLVHEFGVNCENTVAVASVLRGLVDGNRCTLTSSQRDLLQRHVANFDGALSCQRIVRFLQSCELPLTEPAGADLSRRIGVRLWMQRLWLKRFARLILTRSGRRKYQFLRRNFPDLSVFSLDFVMLDYSVQQIDLMMRQRPPMKIDELNASIEKMSATVGGFSAMRAVKLHSGLIAIRK